MSDRPTRIRTVVARPETAVEADPGTGLRIAGLLALLPTAAILLVRVGINAPLTPDLPYSAVYDPIATLAVLGPAFGALLLSVTTRDDVWRATLAFVGVFGVLSVVATPAVVPASVALVIATGILVGGHADRPFSADEIAETLVGVLFFAGLTLSIAGGLGIEPATTRRLGSVAGLLAIAGAPVFVEWRYRTVLVGVVAGGAFAAFGLAAPFVTGAASLVAGGIVGASLSILVVAVVGGVTLVATGVDRGSYEPVVAGLLLLSAGVPATVPRGLAVVIALTLLLHPGTNQ
ncbi:MAG: hypothetical protein ACOCSP_02330 [archaeon]